MAKVIQNEWLWKLTVLSHLRARSYLMKLKKVNLEEAEGNFENYLLFCVTVLLRFYFLLIFLAVFIHSSFRGPAMGLRARWHKNNYTINPIVWGYRQSLFCIQINKLNELNFNEFILGNNSLKYSYI